MLIFFLYRGVAQFGRALCSGRRGRGFESRRLDYTLGREGRKMLKNQRFSSFFFPSISLGIQSGIQLGIQTGIQPIFPTLQPEIPEWNPRVPVSSPLFFCFCDKSFQLYGFLYVPSGLLLSENLLWHP